MYYNDTQKGAKWKQMCEKFPFKETKGDLCRSMLETGLEGVKVGGGGRIRIKFTLFSPD